VDLTAAPACGTDLKLLVVAADGLEPSLASIRKTLDYLGTPYEVFVTATEPALTAAKLSVGCHNFYQGIIYTSAELVYSSPTGFVSSYEAGEQAALQTFAAATKAREVVWFSDWAGPNWGINWPSGGVDTSTSPINASFTAAGKAIFSHVNTANPLTIRNAWTILTTPLDATVKPLLVDAAGHALAVNAKFPDGRDTLTLTFASNPYLIHSQVLGYDLVNWVTRGLFLGERHAYMSPQIDDLYLADTMWTPDTPCGTPIDNTTTEFRTKAKDITALVKWQNTMRVNPLTPGLKLTWAYNGWGAYNNELADSSLKVNNHRIKGRPNSGDDLPPAVTNNASAFYFVSHTWDHPMLDTMTANEVAQELVLNALAGVSLRLNADVKALVTPNVSGLTNPAAMKTVYDFGVRYVVSDTSIAGYSNPTPNTGIYNPLAPGLFMIPRYPTNLYFNVSTPAEWTAEYNCMYGPRAAVPFWDHDFSYTELLNNISDTWLGYLLNGDLNPLMFHQPNTRAYDGVHSLLGDVIDMTVKKYGSLVKFPIQFPSMSAVGDKMIARQKYNEAGVTATLNGNQLTLTATKAAVVPVTGLKNTGAELYAGQSIGVVTLAAGQTKTVTIVP
jgi:hypothetical protein